MGGIRIGSGVAVAAAQGGEVHFPFLDVENNADGGPVIQLLNPPDINADPGAYQIVAVNVIEEAVNGTYDYEGSLNGNRFAKRSGDVNTSQGVDVDAVEGGDDAAR